MPGHRAFTTAEIQRAATMQPRREDMQLLCQVCGARYCARCDAVPVDRRCCNKSLVWIPKPCLLLVQHVMEMRNA